jgi:hypothetical protein
LKEVREIAKQGMTVSFALAAFRGETHHCYIGDEGNIVFAPNHGISLRNDIAVALNFAAQRRRDAKRYERGREDARNSVRQARRHIALMALRSVRLP